MILGKGFVEIAAHNAADPNDPTLKRCPCERMAVTGGGVLLYPEPDGTHRTLPLVAVRQQQNEPRHPQPLGLTGGDELVLTFPDGSSITYEVTGQQFRRRAGGPPLRLARNIGHADFSVDNRTITMTITSSPEGRDNVNQQGTYKVTLRPSGE